jgi:hypothetical protein
MRTMTRKLIRTRQSSARATTTRMKKRRISSAEVLPAEEGDARKAQAKSRNLR